MNDDLNEYYRSRDREERIVNVAAWLIVAIVVIGVILLIAEVVS